MLSVSFTLNCGLFRTFMDAGKEGVYAEPGYRPMLEARQLAQQAADAIGT